MIGAFVEGWRRVFSAPAVWAGLLIVSMFVPAVAVRSRFEGFRTGDLASEGRSVAVQLLHALPSLADPSVVAVDAFRGETITPALAASLGWPLGLFIFLWGGVLDRLARARPVGSAAFFAACGVYLWRFLRLAVPIGLLYWAIDRWLQPNAIAELGAFVLLLIVADYARVRAVVEDRHSMLGSLLASARFIRRRPFAVLALCAVNLVTLALVMVLGRVLAELQVGWVLPAWIRAGQSLALVLLWQWARLAIAGSEIALFQGSLAHAGYTAAPLPVWPDSPAAEAIENLAGQSAEGRGQRPLL